MSCRLVIWSRDTGQPVPCFDRCQKKYTVNQGCMSLSTYYLEDGHCLVPLRCRRCRHRAYAPTSNAATHDNHEKINSWVSFSFLCGYGAPLGGTSGHRSSTINSKLGSWKLHICPEVIKVAENSFQYFSRLRVWCVIITTLYLLTPTSWYQPAAQSSGNKLPLILWHNRLP